MTLDQQYPEVSFHDALMLARRSWGLLVFLPLFIAAAAATIYLTTPTTVRVRAVLNIDLATVELVGKQLDLADRPELGIMFALAGPRMTVVSVDAAHQSVAEKTIDELIAALKPRFLPLSTLAPNDLLELRAQRQYVTFLNSRLAAGRWTNETDREVAAKEAVLAEIRVSEIELLIKPLVERYATVVPSSLPPLLNILVFSYLATLFATWMLVYALERRRKFLSRA